MGKSSLVIFLMLFLTSCDKSNIDSSGKVCNAKSIITENHWRIEKVFGKEVNNVGLNDLYFKDDSNSNVSQSTFSLVFACNSSSGSYYINMDRIVLIPGSSTYAYCGRELDYLEQSLRQALSTVRRYYLFQDKLEFLNSDDTPVVQLCKLDTSCQ